MRRTTFRIRALALALGAASVFTVSGPAFIGGMNAVEAATVKENTNTEDFVKYSKKGLRTILDGTLEGLSLINPAFKPYATLLKGLAGIIFDLGGDTQNPNAEVMKRLDQLEEAMQKNLQSLKDNTYNVVQLSNIGDKFNSVTDKAETIRNLIANYERDANLTREERLLKIAALYNYSEFQSLESAMNGATRCFTSRVNDIFENQSIFEAAYRRTCEEVMFSGEAIDLTIPYLARQLYTYTGAYAVMAEVYDAYEAVHGEGSLSQSHENMFRRLLGCDLNGNNVCKSIPEYFEEYPPWILWMDEPEIGSCSTSCSTSYSKVSAIRNASTRIVLAMIIKLRAKKITLLTFSFLIKIAIIPIIIAIPPNAHSTASEGFICSNEIAGFSAKVSFIPLSADIAVPITTVMIAAFFHFLLPSGFFYGHDEKHHKNQEQDC